MVAKRKPQVFYRWSAKIERTTLPELQKLARGLGFVVTTPGIHDGDPATPKLLDALAAAYRRDPRGTYLALQGLLDANDLLPQAPLAADPTD